MELVGDARGEVGGGVVAEGADLVAGGFAGEVVEGGDAGDDGGEGSGDGGVGGVGEVLLSIDRVFVNAGAEGGANHAGGAAELDEGAGGVDLDAGEAVAGEPGGDGGEVAVSGAEGGAEGLGRQPLVVGGGGLVLLLVDELLEGGLLLGAALEDEDDAVEGGGVGEGALVELGAGEGVGIAGEGGDVGVVDGLEDAGAGGGERGLRGHRGRGGEDESGSRQEKQQSFGDPRHSTIPAAQTGEAETFLAGN